MPNINTNITDSLTPIEKELFSILLEVAKTKSPNTTLRVAGGWTRDKLLGVPSNDIDIMVDNMSGETFARLVTEYLGAKDAHTIKANPEKSKNIETAKAYIPLSSGQTQEVDFARARKEIYNEGSRIPDIKPATAEEDAQRRDLTINSLFYNLSTRKIEDFTGKGIKDLITNTIRTPIDPLQTFKDDPLRIFRVIRFAAKYNGTIDPETYEALKNPELKAEILQKVSKERIGEEIKKMLKNKNSSQALTLLKETGLLSDILQESLKGTKYEGKMAEFDMDQNNPNHTLTFWGHTMKVVSNILDKYQDAEGEKRIAMTLSALCHDLGKLFSDIRKNKEGTDKYPGHEKGYTTYVGHEEESAEIVKYILKYLKLEPYVQEVSGLSKFHMQPHSLVRNDESGEKAMRKFIRRMGELSLNWLDVFNLSVADAYSKGEQVDASVVQTYQNLEKRLQDALVSLSPQKENKIEPILNGNEIMQALGVKPGMHMKDMIEFVKELRDENPNITKEEAIQKLKDKYQASNIGNLPNKEVQQNQSQDNQQKTSSISEESKKKTSACPKHLLDQKNNDIKNEITNKNFYGANSIMKELLEEYGKDECVSRLIALNSLNILIQNQKFRDNNILQCLFDAAKNNFFDYILGAYVLGILLLIDTETEEKVIKEVATRVSNLSPGTMKYVLSLLPTSQINRKEEYTSILDFFQK